MITLHSLIARSTSAAAESVPGDAFVLDLGSGRYYSLGEVGAFVWERLDGRGDLAAIAIAIVAHFEVEPERAGRDLIEFVSGLIAAGLARNAGAEPEPGPRRG